MGDVWSFIMDDEAENAITKPPIKVYGSNICIGYEDYVEVPYSLKPRLTVDIPDAPPQLPPRRCRKQLPLLPQPF